MLVHTSAEQELATAHWLLSAHPAPVQARQEWTDSKVALLPLGTLRDAVEEWRPLGVDCLGRGTYLGVPRVDIREFDPRTFVSYWAMPSADELCVPLKVAGLIAAGKRALVVEAVEGIGPE